MSSFTEPEGPDNFIVPVVTTSSLQNITEHVNISVNISNTTTSTIIHQDSDIYNPNIDILIGSLAIFLTVLGLVGNTLSYLYFRQGRRKSVHHLFYSGISTCDFLISTATFPVITSLLTSRSPALLHHTWICASWPVFYYLIFRVSMILVVVLSITRTLSIVSPMREVKHYANKLMYGVLGYGIVLLTIDVVFLSVHWVEHRYFKYTSLCELSAVRTSTQTEASRNFSSLAGSGGSRDYSPASRVYSFLFQLELIIPCVIVFISFLISTLRLAKRRQTQYTHINSKNEKKFRRVSITITLYTALFLACYLPCFLLQLLYFTSMFHPLPTILTKTFLLYAHLLSQFFLPLLNSATSPCLYFWRMSQFRGWLREVVENPARILERSKYSKAGSSGRDSRGPRSSGRMGGSGRVVGSGRRAETLPRLQGGSMGPVNPSTTLSTL